MRHNDTIRSATLNPYEAVRLGGLRTAVDMEIVDKIYDAFDVQYYETRKRNPSWYTLCLLVTCWNAGRIEGVRMERARRKGNPKTKTANLVSIPVLDIKMMSDFKWQYGCLMSRIEHPEHYKNIDTDVNAVIEKLKQWLREHIDCIGDLKPEEQEKLMTILQEKSA